MYDVNAAEAIIRDEGAFLVAVTPEIYRFLVRHKGALVTLSMFTYDFGSVDEARIVARNLALRPDFLTILIPRPGLPRLKTGPFRTPQDLFYNPERILVLSLEELRSYML